MAQPAKTITKQEVKKNAKGITLRLILTAVLFIIILYLFYFIADEIVLEHNNKLDLFAFKNLALITSDGTTKVMEIFTFFGSTIFLFPAYAFLVIFFFFVKKNKRMALDTAMVGLAGSGLLFLLKDIFRRNRPLDPLVHASGYSFPSGHSFSSFTFFGLMAYMIWQTKIKKTWKIFLTVVCFLLATIIATSRVYLHVHYASDVLGGFCLSMLWLMISLYILHKLDIKLFK